MKFGGTIKLFKRTSTLFKSGGAVDKTFDKVKNVKIKITKPDIFNDCTVSYETSNYP